MKQIQPVFKWCFKYFRQYLRLYAKTKMYNWQGLFWPAFSIECKSCSIYKPLYPSLFFCVCVFIRRDSSEEETELVLILTNRPMTTTAKSAVRNDLWPSRIHFIIKPRANHLISVFSFFARKAQHISLPNYEPYNTVECNAMKIAIKYDF